MLMGFGSRRLVLLLAKVRTAERRRRRLPAVRDHSSFARGITEFATPENRVKATRFCVRSRWALGPCDNGTGAGRSSTANVMKRKASPPTGERGRLEERCETLDDVCREIRTRRKWTRRQGENHRTRRRCIREGEGQVKWFIRLDHGYTSGLNYGEKSAQRNKTPKEQERCFVYIAAGKAEGGMSNVEETPITGATIRDDEGSMPQSGADFCGFMIGYERMATQKTGRHRNNDTGSRRELEL